MAKPNPYKMDDQRFLTVLAAIYDKKVKDEDRVMATLVTNLTAEFGGENTGKDPLTADDVKKKYRSVAAALKRYAVKHKLGNKELKHNLPPDINWTKWMVDAPEEEEEE